MTREEAILYLEHTSSDDFNLEEHQIQNRLNAIQFLLEENQELKKQLENYKKLGFKYLQDKNNNLETQQKEFINYLEDKINHYKINTQCFSMNLIEEILRKYKSIIGVSDETN